MIPESLQRIIGKVDPPRLMEVEKGSIRRYADAVGNDNPLYYDEEHAKKSRYGSIIAPPGFFGWPKTAAPSAGGMGAIMETLFEAGYGGILDGGISYEFYLPIRAGDTLVASPKFADASLKEGKTKMMVCRLETSYLNQNGDLVAKAFHTLIGRQL